MTNPYETLGVPKDASPEEIKKAFRKKASKLHPDRNDEPGAKEQMALVNRAYDTLGDEEKRKRFDETGGTEGPPTIEEEAIARFGQLVTEILNVPNVNVISTAKSKLAEYDKMALTGVAHLTKQVAQLQTRRDKIKVKEGKHNIVHSVIDGQIADINRNLDRIAHGNVIMARVRELLEDYTSDERDPNEQWRENNREFNKGFDQKLGGLGSLFTTR